MHHLPTRHETTCQSGGMYYQRPSQVGECRPLLGQPDCDPGSGTSANPRNVVHYNARMAGRRRTHATLAVRLFIGFSGIGLTMGQAITTQTSVEVTRVSQVLYFCLAAFISKYQMRWRNKTDQKPIAATASFLTILSIVQMCLTFLSLGRKDDRMLNAIHNAGPAPILPAVVALWLYPMGYERMRFKYRRQIAQWDSDTGSTVRLRKLLNTWYKWVAYIAVTAAVWAYGLILFLETDNVYPLLSSVLVLVLSSLMGAIPKFSENIEEVQKKCKGNCQTDVVTIPIIGSSRSTSFILLHFDWKAERMRMERVDSIIAHTQWAYVYNAALLFDVVGDGLMPYSEFTGGAFYSRVWDHYRIVETVGMWHDLSEKTIKMSGQILDALEECPYMHEGHLKLFLFIRAILTESIKSSARKHEMDRNLPDLGYSKVTSMATFIENVTKGKVKSEFEIMCSDHKVLDSDDADALFRSFFGRTKRDVAAMLLVQMAAISGDNRVFIADTLLDGSDIFLDYNFNTKQWSHTTLAASNVLENPNCASCAVSGGVYDVFKKSSAQGLSGKCHQEQPSADSVPTTMTTFKILRQHIMKYLVGYMGASSILIGFGESFN